MLLIDIYAYIIVCLCLLCIAIATMFTANKDEYNMQWNYYVFSALLWLQYRD